jgi:hypothetical protein
MAAARLPKRKAGDVEGQATSNPSGPERPALDSKEKDANKEAKIADKPDPLAEAQRWFALAISEHNARRQQLEAERQAWESERQWMVANIRQVPEEDEVRASFVMS